MKNHVALIGVIILVNACIWGFVIIMSARALSGTGMYQQIQHIMSGGAAMSLLVVGGGLAGLVSALKSGASNQKDE